MKANVILLVAICLTAHLQAAESSNQDLAGARTNFRTKLLKRGPAPQSFKKEIPPPGVMERNYDSGGLALRAWVSAEPKDGKKHPAVVFLHGGMAFGREDWDQASPYANAGFVVITPMLRGENGNPGSFEFFYSEVDDVIAAGKFAVSLPYVDASRVFVAGHSIGGTLAMLSTMSSSLFAAGASFSGSPDQKAFFETWAEAAPFALDNPIEIKLRSPDAFPGSLRCPLFLYVGSEEAAYREKTKALAEAAQKLGKSCKAFVLPGDHMSYVEAAIGQSIKLFKEISPKKN